MEKKEVGLCQGEGASVFQKNTPEVQRAAHIINVCASCPVLMCTICYFYLLISKAGNRNAHNIWIEPKKDWSLKKPWKNDAIG